ncbi:MAG: glutamate-cysteine ligase family protein [Eggerthellaceae bacterium]
MSNGENAAQPCREKNIEILVGRLLGNASAQTDGFGVEANYTLANEDGTPVRFMDQEGIGALLDRLSGTYPDQVFNEDGMLTAVQRMEGGVLEVVSYEGDGALKLSAGPFADLMRSNTVFADFKNLVEGLISESHQTITQQNLMPTGIDALLEQRQKSTDQLGIELEQFILHGDLSRVSYSEENGIRSLLEELSASWDGTIESETGDLIGLSRTVDGILQTITLEPAGQLELSAGPYRDLNEAKGQFQDFEDELTKVLQARNQMIIPLGYMPVGKAEELEMIPKSRYTCMDRHFRQFGPYGTCMMRGSASTQVSIDFKDAQDCKRKFRLANALGPILALMCCNTMMFEGEPCEHIMMRTMMWNGVDRARCNVAPGAFDEDWTVRTYAEWLLDIPAVCVPDGNGGFTYDERTFGEIYANKVITPEEADHIISMVFPDVRLKGYIEIRVADSMPVDYTAAYAALIKGLFSTEEGLSQAESVIGIDHIRSKDITLAKLAMMEKGYDAEIYGDKNVQTMAQRLHMIAKLHLNSDERQVIEPLTTLTMNGYTLAELTDLML